MATRTGVVSRRLAASADSGQTIEVTAVPLLFERELAFVVIMHDVTEQERMEARLAFAERLALVGQLASGVGHEINNPLAYMLGSLDLARADLLRLGRASERDGAGAAESALVERLERHLGTVKDGALRVRDIVRDLKLLSMAGDDRLAPVDVENALDLAAATVLHEIKPRARLVQAYGSVPLALANEQRLVQVFVNLLVNAAQAIPEGDPGEHEIRVATCEAGGRVVVEVTDTGTGIAERDLPRIFEPFFTTKGHGGTGLGLSISHTIVTAHGGRLTAERRAPRGALFRVELKVAGPASAPPSSIAGSGPREAAGGPGAIERSGARVLVVDDEPRAARVIAEFLAAHDVTLAHSGREAITRLDGGAPFDAIVCDLQMTDGTGIDVYEHIVRHAPALADRVIFITGGAFTDRARDFLHRCTRPVLEKPFRASQLERLVAGLVRRSR
jgi:signal transduction histidine kinase/CheY-like chemotaxis protein